MMKIPRLTFTLHLLLIVLSPLFGEETSDFKSSAAVETIAFGSCFNPRDQRPEIFDGIIHRKPDLFIFLGDNIYGDTEDMELLQKKWAKLGAIKGFQDLRKSTPILATWDDHDYGVNDGGKSYPKRKESERIFLDFFQEAADSPRRQREGLYGSYLYGPPGKRCQILLLDTRYFRDELTKSKEKPSKGSIGWYQATQDTSMTLLGEAQWKWLDAQLKVPADIRIIASSIQLLAHEKSMENWAHVPHEQARLFELLKKHKAHHTFAISGDVHFGELSKKEIDGYPFYDFTSSGMSFPRKKWANAPNSFRVGEATWEPNAGLIEIDWDKKSVALSAINPKGEKIFSHGIALSDLKFR